MEKQRYSAAKGGHAPGHLRSVLEEALESKAQSWPEAFAGIDSDILWNEDVQRHWETMDGQARAVWLTGQLWNCTDILPSGACQELDLPAGSTYAIAARKIRAELH